MNKTTFSILLLSALNMPLAIADSNSTPNDNLSLAKLDMTAASGSRTAQILTDGQVISEQHSFYGAASLLFAVNITERIETVKGPASILYGSKAIGGEVDADSGAPSTRSPSAKTADHSDGWATLNRSMNTDRGVQNLVYFTRIFEKTYTPSLESLTTLGRHFAVKTGTKL